MELKDVAEQTRTYMYPNGDSITIKDVVKVGIVASGGHRLELKDGSKMIPRSGWIAIKLDGASEWSF